MQWTIQTCQAATFIELILQKPPNLHTKHQRVIKRKPSNQLSFMLFETDQGMRQPHGKSDQHIIRKYGYRFVV